MSAQPIETTAPASAAAKPRKAGVPLIQAIRQEMLAVDLAASSHQVAGARLLELEWQWKARMAAAEVRGQSDEELDANCQALVPIEMEIANAPCESMAAFMAKLRTVVRQGAVYGQLTDIDNAALIDGMIAFIEGRFGGDQAVALAS